MKTNKQLWTLFIVAIMLGGVYFLLNRRMHQTNAPAEVGKPLLGGVDLNHVTQVDIKKDGKLLEIKLDGDTWRVPSMANYPADFDRIRANIRTLNDVKVSDVLNGMDLEGVTDLILKDKAGKEVAVLHLGQARQKGVSSGMMWQPAAEGRYLRVGNNEKIFLVKEALSEFTPDARAWVKTDLLAIPATDVETIAVTPAVTNQAVTFDRSSGTLVMQNLHDGETFDASKAYTLESALSYLRFSDVFPATTADATTGLSTGVQFRVTLKNGEAITARVGKSLPDGNRYLALSAEIAKAPEDSTELADLQNIVSGHNANFSPWVYAIPAYAADNMTRPRADFLKKADAKEVSEPLSLGTDDATIKSTEH